MLVKTNRIVILLSVCMCCVFFLSFSNFGSECQLVKDGTFHFYPNSKKTHHIIVRKDTLQTEIDLSTGDTSCWRIKWVSQCVFTCNFISITKSISKEELEFCNNSTLKFTVSRVSKEYYTYDALFTYNNISKTFSDTMWFHSK